MIRIRRLWQTSIGMRANSNEVKMPFGQSKLGGGGIYVNLEAAGLTMRSPSRTK